MLSLARSFLVRTKVNTRPIHTENERTLKSYGLKILTTPDPIEKVRLSNLALSDWKNKKITLNRSDHDPILPPLFPSRPPKPICVEPQNLPSQKTVLDSGVSVSVYMLHNLAHIELNAVDLAWDTLLRAHSHNDIPNEFFSDWIEVACDEGRHFSMISEQLQRLGAAYGDIMAHSNLWRIATDTAHDLKERICIIQLVQEARGLDSWHRLVCRFIFHSWININEY
eukprot:TRINITY_DN2498_c0_g1_i1.p1 TRINITY_DN2498_c0_g1~~TRINITY_DN2498_c0_g1_i1.p1  ORF type:complete len:225 (+),score=26.49 TRINITY_DN2498_c0_g1_i1:65-739(+)